MSKILNYNRTLENSGFTRNKSEALLKVLISMLKETDFMTRSDAQMMEMRLEKKIDQVESNLFKKLVAAIGIATSFLAFFIEYSMN